MTDDRKRLRPSPSVGPDAPPREPSRPSPGNEKTTEQLRSDIDSGHTRDKVAFPDPAAAPLGTDAEAGGTPAPKHTVEVEREPATEGPERPRIAIPAQAQRPWMIWLIVAAAVAGGIAVLFGE